MKPLKRDGWNQHQRNLAKNWTMGDPKHTTGWNQSSLVETKNASIDPDFPWKSTPHYWKNHRAEWQPLNTLLLQYLQYLTLCPCTLIYQPLKKRGTRDGAKISPFPRKDCRGRKDKWETEAFLAFFGYWYLSSYLISFSWREGRSHTFNWLKLEKE